MATGYFLLYWSLFIVVGVYLSAMVIAFVTALIVVINTGKWEVNTSDPMLKTKGILRKVEPFEILAITRGGKPAFPIVDKNEQRLTFEGLKGDGSGISSEKPGQWKVVKLPDGDEYPEIIQSVWGAFSPLYVFRTIVYSFTQRHVVRVLFPFFIAGFYELYAPHIMKFVRARAEKLNEKEKEERIEKGSMIVLDQVFESTMQIVQDSTIKSFLGKIGRRRYRVLLTMRQQGCFVVAT
ncbi:MAG: hypothetical protein UV60_C0047G0007 [Parcubacteria group bacterium GW2011_GWA2_43_11]|nr:MAG: hypothetical protein UV60_C0047G0007 [Parcubacteria group bacterium GW2011_GWA2_43_11]